MAPNNTSNEGNQMNWERLVAPCGKQQIESPKETPKYNSQLGTYNAAVTPMMVLLLGFSCGAYVYRDYEMDPRVEGWLLVGNMWGTVGISILYILFSVVWGPRWMRGRKPMQLTKFMIVYNAFQVLISLYMFLETGLAGWFFDYNYRCQPCDHSNSFNGIRMARAAHWYFLSKQLDFIDTFLFILRGKLNQVTMLHIIHHSCMFMSMWFGVQHTPGGHITFMGFLNTFVHVIMYSYYLLAAMGPRVRPYLWWKRYLTTLQLTQFVLIFLHAAQLLVFPCEGVPTSLVLWTLLYAFIFFVLFINFYVEAYLFGPNRKKGASAAVQNKEQNGKSNGQLDGQQSNGLYESKQQHSNSNGNSNITSFMNGRVKHRQPSSSSVVQ
uniref:Elongation of very long chain fatty acids protein n=2 Tax=Hirondellea gigas TaxID=1518452 RepID=A0A6A7G856_9CRUS